MKDSEVIKVDAAGRTWTVAVANGRKHSAQIPAPNDDREFAFWEAVQSKSKRRIKSTDHWHATFAFTTPTGPAERSGELWFNSGNATIDSVTATAFSRAQGRLPALDLKITLLRRTDESARAHADQVAEAERQRVARVAKYAGSENSGAPTNAAHTVDPVVPDPPLSLDALDAALRAIRTEFDRDPRAPIDSYRRGRFKTGWREASSGQIYGGKFLEELSWQNLGYRLGRAFGLRAETVIDVAFEHCAVHFAPPIAPMDGDPDDVAVGDPPLAAIEGAAKVVVQTRYERDPRNRATCLAHHGHACKCCGLEFGKAFPGVARADGFIHVHHVRPLSEVAVAHAVDPINDLIPLCPNCHAVVHMRRPAFTLDELRDLRRVG